MAFIAQEGRRAFMIRVGIAGIGYIAEEYIKLFSQGKIKDATPCAFQQKLCTYGGD